VASSGATAVQPTRSLADLSGPRGLPLLGNALQLDPKRLSTTLEGWADRYGLTYRLRLGNRTVLVTAEPDAVATALRQRPDGFRRISTVEPTFAEMGIEGVFSVEADRWRRLRRLTMQGLNAEYLRQYFDTIVRVTKRLYERWDRLTSDGVVEIDVQREMMRYTLDVTANLSLGYDLNSLEKDDDPLQTALATIFPMIGRRLIAVFPYWRYVRLPADRRLDRALADIDVTIQEIIDAARSRRGDTSRPPTDILEAILAAPDDGDPFTDSEIKGSVLTIMLAGQETTASTMSWMVYCLTEHPRVQQRIRDEVAAVLGPDRTVPDYADMARLPYLTAVVNETLRVKPITPLNYVEPNADTVLAGVAVPRGTTVFLLMNYLAQKDDHFTAAATFDPDRWLRDRPEAAETRHDSRVFVPFGAGPRYCPGRNLAMLEATMAMATAIHAFEFTRPPDAGPPQREEAFTVQPVGLAARLTRRPT
jgi:cytochrome P450